MKIPLDFEVEVEYDVTEFVDANRKTDLNRGAVPRSSTINPSPNEVKVTVQFPMCKRVARRGNRVFDGAELGSTGRGIGEKRTPIRFLRNGIQA